MSWQDDARCRTHDPEIFFATGARAERRAKAICNRCPVAELCLQFALESKTDFGVWGGLSGRERNRLVRRGRSPSTQEPVPVAL